MKTKENFKFTRNKNNKVAVYIRANNVDGVATQLFRALEYARNKGVVISPSRIYADISSGNQFPRPAFDRMMTEKLAKGYDTVLVTSLDRLGRSPETTLMSRMQLVFNKLTLEVVA